MCNVQICKYADEQPDLHIFISADLHIFLYFRAKFVTKMEQQRTEKRKKSTGLYWLLFLASSALLVFAIWAHWEYLTLILPFQITFFAKALDIM
jgi:hypothetical protein